MDLPVGKKQSKEFWKAHIDACASYPGSMAAYCEENGLSKPRFTYHRQKYLGEKSKFAEVKAVERSVGAPASREPVTSQHKLPDPKWVAALIRELGR